MNRLNQYTGLFNVIIMFFLMIVILRTCGTEIKVMNKRIDSLSYKIDSLNKITVTHDDLKIEGLKTEKRMIQSTDRKIMDVNRQSEIDKEIDILSK